MVDVIATTEKLIVVKTKDGRIVKVRDNDFSVNKSTVTLQDYGLTEKKEERKASYDDFIAGSDFVRYVIRPIVEENKKLLKALEKMEKELFREKVVNIISRGDGEIPYKCGECKEDLSVDDLQKIACKDLECDCNKKVGDAEGREREKNINQI